MSLELYRVEHGPVGLHKLARNGGWGDIEGFLQMVHVNDSIAYNNYVWWITDVLSIPTRNNIAKDMYDTTDSLTVCLVSPPRGTEQRYAVLNKITAFCIGGYWYITEGSFDKAMNRCFSYGEDATEQGGEGDTK